MCGRFTLVISPEMLAEIFSSPVLVDLPRRYNIAPTKQVLSIRRTEAVNQASFMRWGLIPSWAKDASIGSRMINARSETVHEITAFRAVIRHPRCNMPASGFFEWKEEGGKEQSLFIRIKNGAIMAIAGIWNHWKDPECPATQEFGPSFCHSEAVIHPETGLIGIDLDEGVFKSGGFFDLMG